MKLKSIAASVLAATGIMAGTTASAADEITVGYFLEWPMPFQAAKVAGAYDEALGMKVNWVAFESGTAMSAAMASGDVHISVSQGLPPFVIATSAGQDLQIIDVAVSYSDNDNCVVRSDLEIDKSNASELVGKKVGVPLGTAAHYGFLKQMNHFGVSLDSLEVVGMQNPDAAVALSQGSVDMACGWGGALARMKENGNTLLTGSEKEELGILVFDVTSAPADFVAENSDLITKFLAVTADANEAWNASQPTFMLNMIANDSGMSAEAAASQLSTFEFPSVKDQLSSQWLGGNAQEFMKGVAQVFVEAGKIPSANASYAGNVETGPLAATGM